MTLRIQAAIISTTSSSNSFFVELSRKIDGQINLYVYRHPRDSLYYVLAHIPKPIAYDVIAESVRNYHDNMLKINKHIFPQETFLVAVKQQCEFYELVENYNVVVSIPYLVYKGQRIYCVYGEAGDVEKYIDNVLARYNRKNVVMKKVDPITCITHQMRNTINAYVFSFLTDKEKQLIVKALESGYISSRRRVSLEELAESLNIAKPTASLMLRKAIEKILKRLVESDF
ncbi:MAG: helix-turn-helix domain-containing protein [Ignisphaera sp.]